MVDDATPVGEVLRVARMSAGPLLAELRLFDVYRGEQIGAGRVSYALAFRFQPDDAGDEKDVDKALNKVRGSLSTTSAPRSGRSIVPCRPPTGLVPLRPPERPLGARHDAAGGRGVELLRS